MPEPAASDRTRSYLVVLATVGMIVFNWMAAVGYVNGVTPEVVSNKYPTIVTPAGYAFAIWSLIYLGLAAFSIYQVLPATTAKFRSARTPYIVSCVLNCAWIYFWHHDQIAICLAVIVFLWLSLLWTYFRLDPQSTTAQTWLIKAPFGIYMGWICAAALVNLAVTVRWLGIDLSPFATVIFGAALVFLAAIIGVTARLTLRNFFFPLAVAWALTAIAVKQSGQTPVVVAAAVGVVASLIATLSFVVNLKGTPDE